jgi:predicted ester cyclase
MSTSKNKTIVRNFFEEWNSTDINSVVDRYFSPDFVSHDKWRNCEGLKKVIKDAKAGLSGFGVTIEDIIAENDKVAVRVRFISAARDVSAILIYRVDNGKIVEEWAHGETFF